ncbi:TRAP transporter substrate-binding protein [Salipiger abyssi]|uniref:TRAP transporter substrate-binding protein n=1 Tax=Salipiger abyssi TaxID=1250539 RepID=UPI001A8CAD05|nr:TRAP transporter substrate-binding protein [Salipiger abyssi]MBN9885856.1 TRAP transporter substrate-binding protein [Salipiger abyssi]
MKHAILSAVTAAALVLPAVASAEITLRLGETTAPNHPQTQRDVRVAELVSEKTGGEVVIETFPAGQLGNAPAQMESMMTGGQDMFGGTAVFAGGYEDNWRVLSLYFLFSSPEHIAAFEKSDIFDEMNEDLIEATGVRALSVAAVRGPSAFISKTEIAGVEDIKGKKVRIPGVEGYALSLEALGAVPTPVAWTETYMAFSQGVIDVVQSSLSGIKSERFTDSGSYVVNIGHNWEPTGLFIAESAWEKLSEEQQTALMDSIVQANDEAWAKAAEGEEALKDDLRAAGAEIYEGDQGPWRESILENLVPTLAAEGFWTIPDLFPRIVALDPAAN